ncbi:hypothetical protein LCGC14_0847970 [marine sediment metagenome]|uniref:Uncharacterized protein n=1 Tax=marine sediment metagenome TaxID=412755 RepID=A0A0F9RVZ2_9ZZZZ
MPTPQEWQQRAEQWVPAFMAEHPTITNADILFDQMRESDMYVPRVYVRDEWRSRKDEGRYMDIVEMMSDADMIPKGWMRKTSLNYKEKMIWKVSIVGELTEGGVAVDRTVTIEAGENMQIGPVLDVAWGYAFQYGINLFDAPPTIKIVEAMYA